MDAEKIVLLFANKLFIAADDEVGKTPLGFLFSPSIIRGRTFEEHINLGILLPVMFDFL